MENEVKSQGYKICIYVRDDAEASAIKGLIKKYKELTKSGVVIDSETLIGINDKEMDLVCKFATKICTEIESRTLKTESSAPKKLEGWMSTEQRYEFFANKFPNVSPELINELAKSWVSDEERQIIGLDLYGLIEYKNDIMKKSNFYDIRLFEATKLNQAMKDEIQTSRSF